MKHLRISSLEAEGVYQGSKWMKFQVLCDVEELQNLFQRFHPFSIFPLTGIVEGKPIGQEQFLSEYQSWIDGLKQGLIPQERDLRKVLASAITQDPESLWLQEIAGKGYLAKIAKPVLQVQAHWFTYSAIDDVFRPMSMGSSSIFWGLQFSYPGIYQDPKTMEFVQTRAPFFIEVMREWIRDQTRPTPFIVHGKQVNSPIRLGKRCFSWIHSHPQLLQQGISIRGD